MLRVVSVDEANLHRLVKGAVLALRAVDFRHVLIVLIPGTTIQIDFLFPMRNP